ncbi:hypothetical protein SSX86_026294 [Deinandra increscens subsp. villosa]|uniref:Uncharacterized protein n=1 Tax=Deinandra increscens subsp. villosa TaxID=3103831 RepID=A0AAP0GNU6_9ASTR
MTLQAVPSISPTSQPFHHSPWHSPVPYLFGGLAAMLGLISFALLILACSYWKLSGETESSGGGQGERDLEAGDSKPDNHEKEVPVFEEKYLVIMAGEARPTFLATVVSSRVSSFGSCSDSSSDEKSSTSSDEEMMEEKEKEVTANREIADQVP